MAGTESNRKWRQAVAMAAAALLVAQVLLALASWLLLSIRNSQLSIANCQLSIFNCHRSLLSGQGVRWLAAHFVDGLQSPLLVWLLLAAAAAGIVRRSRLFSVRRPDANSQLSIVNHPRSASLILLAVYVLIVLLLTAPPHAVLLSATGHLWPSPFSQALVPIVCLGAVVAAIGYGLAARTLTTLTSIVDAAAEGLRGAAPLFLLYILAMQFYLSLHYVFVQ